MKIFLKVIALSAVLAAVALAALVGYSEYQVDQPLPIEEKTTVVLDRGQSFSEFAKRLGADGLIERPVLWTLRARLLGQARKVQAGEYQISPGDSAAVLLQKLLSGAVVNYQIQVIEGWTVRQALRALAQHPQLRQELAGVDEHTLLDVLGLPGGHAEGMFFPDTYQFSRGASDADILRRAYDALQARLASAWESRAAGLPYESAYEALVAASLVEKETGREEDRAQIAQVFVSRLNRRMRLQTDPSVIYGIGPSFNGDLTRRDLRTDTPYNTYTRKGLPPTPIALVGEASLDAALHPTAGEYLYFVSRGDGSSQFSVSLEEHRAAVRKYQLR